MDKKFELTNETKRIGDIVLYRIKAIKNFGNIKSGNIGGWIEIEGNLDHNGQVYGNAFAAVFAGVYRILL